MCDLPMEPCSDELDQPHRRLDVQTRNHGGTAVDDIAATSQYCGEEGVQPPDPLLDEVDDMRRQIMAEHRNDWRKVLQWHLDQDQSLRTEDGGDPMPRIEDKTAAVSGR